MDFGDANMSRLFAPVPLSLLGIALLYLTSLIKRANLSLNHVLKYVGESALSGLPMFSAASLFRTKHNRL
jgi:hypothetical protein